MTTLVLRQCCWDHWTMYVWMKRSWNWTVIMLKMMGVPIFGPPLIHELKEANCHMWTKLNQTEPNLPWYNTAEGVIREPKKGSSRQIIRTGSPNKIWDHDLRQQALIQPHTYNSIRILNGETPGMLMKEETADISCLCEFAWFEWSIFHDSPVQYHGDFVTLVGPYLGPSPDVASPMTYSRLKPEWIDFPPNCTPLAHYDWACSWDTATWMSAIWQKHGHWT